MSALSLSYLSALTLEVIVVAVAILTQHSSQLANQRGDFCGGGGAVLIG